jgi:hypothetical protein
MLIYNSIFLYPNNRPKLKLFFFKFKKNNYGKGCNVANIGRWSLAGICGCNTSILIGP